MSIYIPNSSHEETFNKYFKGQNSFVFLGGVLLRVAKTGLKEILGIDFSDDSPSYHEAKRPNYTSISSAWKPLASLFKPMPQLKYNETRLESDSLYELYHYHFPDFTGSAQDLCTPQALVPFNPSMNHRTDKGIENLGLTCYLNITVQRLAFRPDLDQALIIQEGKEGVSLANALKTQLTKIINTLRSDNPNKVSSDDMRYLCCLLKGKLEDSPTRMNDCNEAFLKIIENLGYDLPPLGIEKTDSYITLDQSEIRVMPDEKRPDAEIEFLLKPNIESKSWIDHARSVCKEEGSDIFIKTNELSIEISDPSDFTSIDQITRLYTESRDFDPRVMCSSLGIRNTEKVLKKVEEDLASQIYKERSQLSSFTPTEKYIRSFFFFKILSVLHLEEQLPPSEKIEEKATEQEKIQLIQIDKFDVSMTHLEKAFNILFAAYKRNPENNFSLYRLKKDLKLETPPERIPFTLARYRYLFPRGMLALPTEIPLNQLFPLKQKNNSLGREEITPEPLYYLSEVQFYPGDCHYTCLQRPNEALRQAFFINDDSVETIDLDSENFTNLRWDSLRSFTYTRKEM